MKYSIQMKNFARFHIMRPRNECNFPIWFSIHFDFEKNL